MRTLFLLQFACCLVTGMLAMMLGWSHFQMKWRVSRYETSRWLFCFALAILSLHFILQMLHGIRDKSDEMGAIVNILFYSPIALMISYATYNIVCSRVHGRRRFVCAGIFFYLLILVTFCVGVIVSGGLQIGFWLYAMLAIFAASLVFCIVCNVVAMHNHRKIMESESATDMLPYDSYAKAGYVMMGASALLFTCAIAYRPLLLVVGPFMLVALFIFTMCFIGYGFNILPADMDLQDAVRLRGHGILYKLNVSDAAIAADGQEDSAFIRLALDDWCRHGGFRDSAANMLSLANSINIQKEELIGYFTRKNTTFRIWLNDIRFEEACRMLRDNPGSSGERISSECGFSSYAHMERVFRENTGMTPMQWKDFSDSRL